MNNYKIYWNENITEVHFEVISAQSLWFLSMFISVKRFEIQKVPEVKIIFCYKTSFPFIHKQCWFISKTLLEYLGLELYDKIGRYWYINKFPHHNIQLLADITRLWFSILSYNYCIKIKYNQRTTYVNNLNIKLPNVDTPNENELKEVKSLFVVSQLNGL